VKKLLPMLLCLLLLLSGCSLERLMAMETHEANPVSSACTALVFGAREANGPVWVVTDAETIAGLRDSYQWTHDHMLCCLEGTVTDYIDFVEGNVLAPWELSKHKLYQEDDVLAYNAVFRQRLRAARDNAVPMHRTVVQADSADRLDDIRSALPGCIAAFDQSGTSTTVHVITQAPLTEAEIELLRSLPGVTLP
jgi:hypothetical protein